MYNNFEKEPFENIEVNLNDKMGSFIRIENSDLAGMKEEIDSILGNKSDFDSEKISYHSFSNKEEYDSFIKDNIPDSEGMSKDNAVFYINPDTQGKMVINYTPVPSEEDISKAEQYGYSLDEMKKRVKSDVLSSFAHETTHMQPFFKNKGNDGTANMWEQEQICVYVGEKTRGDISDVLFKKGLINDEAIDSFTLNDGNWDNFEKGKSIVVNYFYPFLVKEYGIDKVRMIWERLQANPEIEESLRTILGQKPDDLVDSFKEKIKDRQYLKSIFD